MSTTDSDRTVELEELSNNNKTIDKLKEIKNENDTGPKSEELKLLNKKTKKAPEKGKKSKEALEKEQAEEINAQARNIQFIKDLTNDSFYTGHELDNTFIVFKSINEIIFLIYTGDNKSIIAFDLIDNRIICKVINAHDKYITNFRHYSDANKERDLLLSVSYEDNNIKIWNILNWNCILNLKDIYKRGKIYSAGFLDYKSKIYIIISNYNVYINYQPIKVLDLNGNEKKEIDDSKDKTAFIDSFYDKKLGKNYIVTGNRGFVKSFDFRENKLYHKYRHNQKDEMHTSIIMNIKDNAVEMIESCNDAYIRIWNFHTGKLIKKIKPCNSRLYGICLWYKEYVLVGCEDETIKLIDLKNEKNIMSLTGHTGRVFTVKTINLPEYGECLISQSWLAKQIKLWSVKTEKNNV